MNTKAKGTSFEREMIHLFWKSGWAAVRVAGSGSSRYPSPDLIAGNNLRNVAIECKYTKEQSVYLGKDEIEALVTFARMFGAEPWIAVKFGKEKVYVVSIEDLKQTNQCSVVSCELAMQKGLLFDEFVK